MANQLIYFRQNAPCNWEWPVRLGIVDKPDSFVKLVRDGYWSKKKLSVVESVSSNEHYNIIYTDCSVSDLNKNIKKLHFQANVIVIHVPESFFLEIYNEQEFEPLLKDIADKTNAHAVLFVSFSIEVEVWFNNVVMELSHDDSIEEALVNTCHSVAGIFDYSLDKYSRLSYLLYKIAEVLRVRYWSDSRVYNIQSKWISQEPVNLDVLSNLIKNFQSQARFDHESDEASDMIELINSINEELGISVLHETIVEPMSPPPTESAPPESMPDSSPVPIPEIIDRDVKEILIMNPGDEAAGAKPPDEDLEDNKKNDPSQVDNNRYLQATIKNSLNEDVDYLLTKSAYKIKVRIGSFSRKWIQSPTTSFPAKEIFTDPAKDEEIIQIQLRSNLSKTIQIADLTLHKTGNSDEVEFTIQTPSEKKVLEAEISVYHKNRLIQKATLTSQILLDTDDPDAFPATTMEVDVKIVANLSNLANRMPFAASIIYEKDNKNGAGIQGIVDNKPLDLNFSPALEKLVASIRDRIQQAVINFEDEDENLYAPVNQELLLQMALDGNDLFVNHLKQRNDFNGPIQIISNKSEFIPLDFVYSFAAPADDAVVCPNASTALLAGKCCGSKDVEKAPAKCICPFGFFGFSHIIEHHTAERMSQNGNADYSVITEPSTQRKPLSILQNALYATSNKVSAEDPSLTNALATSLQQNIGHAIEAKGWAEWGTLVEKEKPDSLILIVHIEKRALDDRLQVEIGQKDFLLKNLLDKTKISSTKKTQPPFIIFIGCEATNLEHYGFDLSSQLMNHGAAIVISNFTKIRGRHAAPIVMKLLEFLKANIDKEFTLGEIVLKLRQYLLAKGVIVGFGLTTLGDADWKIKIA